MHHVRALLTNVVCVSYCGEWENDARNGHGVMQWANSNKYTGQWLDDRLHFKGHMQYCDGDTYNGEWHNGYKKGQGTYTLANGHILAAGLFDEEPTGSAAELNPSCFLDLETSSGARRPAPAFTFNPNTPNTPTQSVQGSDGLPEQIAGLNLEH